MIKPSITYEFKQFSAFSYKISFSENGELCIQFGPLKRKIVIPLGSIRRLTLKPSQGLVRLNIRYSPTGTGERNIPITLQPIDKMAADFIRDLKNRTTGIPWEIKYPRQDPSRPMEKVYPLTAVINALLRKSYARRWLFLFFWGLMSLMIVPFPFFLYLVLGGRYRLITSAEGVTVKKVRTWQRGWNDISRIEWQRLNIHNRMYGFTMTVSRWFIFTLHPSTGRPVKFSLDALEAGEFFKELVARGKCSDEILHDVVLQ
ncbi:MAG: hypothetical protein HY541_05585 [Deltaproteobacteria bacterium]|nr:hypothetical protein [Deltaproteobacteria bacterium]